MKRSMQATWLMQMQSKKKYQQYWTKKMDKTKTDNSSWTTVDGHGVVAPCPELMTEEELIVFLRIPLISKANNYNNVIENLKKNRLNSC